MSQVLSPLIKDPFIGFRIPNNDIILLKTLKNPWIQSRNFRRFQGSVFSEDQADWMENDILPTHLEFRV